MFLDLDESCYDNIPKRYLKYKDKEFDEWEIPPWKLLIDKEKKLGSGESKYTRREKTFVYKGI